LRFAISSFFPRGLVGIQVFYGAGIWFLRCNMASDLNTNPGDALLTSLAKASRNVIEIFYGMNGGYRGPDSSIDFLKAL